jgi:glutathione S-transferase
MSKFGGSVKETGVDVAAARFQKHAQSTVPAIAPSLPMRMRLYYRPQTGRPARVAWALEELGVEYEQVALSTDECLDQTHLKRHPLGRVPALELDDGDVLFESTAIVLAIADRYPQGGLIGPLGSTLRRQVYEWSIMAVTELERTALGAWKLTDHVQDEYRRRQREAYARAAAAVGRQLADQPFLLGAALTAADIVLGGVLAVSKFVAVLDAAPTSVVDYFDRLQARFAYSRALARTESLLLPRQSVPT